ncbi:hypothetical protein DEJ48_38625 [Streptomyces venezuelae]|uniref:Secreted protein n=1 Tax=Streptomyces venezuelae TaxID=54571 RepID=A0A5P2CCS2_STRVZ|nr:hypothetical protein [Streptomyces venezuelae]QES38549.1 hypothetical protein DEJ48_38625 [Streptomyces venezuelae]
MRKTTTAAVLCVAAIAMPVPATAAQAAPSADVRILADCSPHGSDGKVYAWLHSNCSGTLLGSDVGNDANWGDASGQFRGSDDNNATSVANNGHVGGKDVVAFYRLTGGGDAWAGGFLCAGPGVALTDLHGYAFTSGHNANDRISSHQWVYPADCARDAFIDS